ncbi:MAG: diguanylate cyclase [Microcoleaceae cyanobacterium]
MNQTSQTDEKADILIVDDTPDNLRVLSSMLIEAGYKVRKAINGTMALRSIQAEPPDLILLDIRMPELSGYEVCAQLKNQPETKNIPVIFLSALDNEKDKVAAFEIGGVDYVTKPLQLQEVLVRVKTHLTLQQQQQQLQQQNNRLQQEVKARAAAELALQKANSKLQRLAHLDSVTHVANRLRFEEYLPHYWQKLAKKQLSLSLIFCKVDHFENYVESLDTSVVEESLRTIAWAINRSIKPPKDLVARYSDFRFAIILPNQSLDKVLQWAETLKTEMAQLDLSSFSTAKAENITVSLGISRLVCDQKLEPKLLVSQADRALQNALEQGGDRTIVFGETES